MPEPSAVQVVPSHEAMAFAATVPAWSKLPATTRAPFPTARAWTDGGVMLGPSVRMPVLSADQVAPSQRATLLATAGPAEANEPPTTRLPFQTRSAFTSGRTTPRGAP